MEKVTKDTNIAKLITKYPQTAEVFLAFGLSCVGCFASQFDTIEAGAQIHQMMDDEIDEMIEELNNVISDNDSVKDSDYVSSDNSKLKVKVDKDSCIGCGTCVVVAPKTFGMNDDYKSVVIKNFSDDNSTIKEAESTCPVDAISIKE